jgi:hypothetical protein
MAKPLAKLRPRASGRKRGGRLKLPHEPRRFLAARSASSVAYSLRGPVNAAGPLKRIPIYFRDCRSEPAAALTGCQLRSRDRNRNKLTQGDQASGLLFLVGRAGYGRKEAVIGNMPSEEFGAGVTRMSAVTANGGYRAIPPQEQPFLLHLRVPEFLDLPQFQA